jgi:hypothetical protein
MVNPNWQVRMLAFDFEPGVKAWRRACFAQGWYWTREQYATLSGDREGPLVEPIAKDLGTAVAAVLALYESTFRDACVMEWTLEETTWNLSRASKWSALDRSPVLSSKGAVRPGHRNAAPACSAGHRSRYIWGLQPAGLIADKTVAGTGHLRCGTQAGVPRIELTGFELIGPRATATISSWLGSIIADKNLDTCHTMRAP